MTQERNVLALFKGQSGSSSSTTTTAAKRSSTTSATRPPTPRIPINWFDAAVLTERVRNHQESEAPQEEY